MKLVFTVTASLSLEAIAAYVEKDNPSAARQLVDLLLERIQALLDFPSSYPRAPRYGDDMRMMPVGRYVVLYRVASDRVVIRQIVHSARDIERLLRLPREG